MKKGIRKTWMAQEKREQERETINNNTMAINTFLNCNSEYIKCHGVAGGGGGCGGGTC